MSLGMKHLKFLLLVCLLPLTAHSIHAQNNTCRLTYAYLDKETGILASTHGVATFSFAAEDEDIMKAFFHEESGANIIVGAQIYGSADRRAKRQIEVAIAFGEPTRFKVDDLFHYADSSVAEAVYDGNWVSVSKTLETAKRIYRFRFGCVTEKPKIKTRRTNR
jgi:hypothetical protein